MFTPIVYAVSFPRFAKCRIGHFVEAHILDCVDECEILTVVHEGNHIMMYVVKMP